MTLHTADTNALSAEFLAALRRMLERAFPGDFGEHDWEHALGGTHIWVDGPDGIVSHASIVVRTLVCSGQTLRAGYVEAVATVEEHRRRGHGTAVMRQSGELIRDRYELGALSTGLVAFYQRLGWELWRGPTFVASPHGLRRTAEDDGDVMILRTPRTPPIDLDAGIVCDWRAGDPW